jgi:autotransporter-associated beta strand protein
MCHPPQFHFRILLLPQCAASLLLSFSAFAANGTWINPGSSAWTSTGSWSGTNIANGSMANANFSTLDLQGDLTLLLNGARTIGSLTLGDVNPSHNFNLRPGTGGSLTLDNGGGSPVIQVHNGTATMSVVLAGNSGISKTGAGTLVLAGNNVYSGPTLITSGTLRLECPPSFPSNMSVMPLGDSITYGFNGSNAGYRGPLYHILNPLVPDFRYIGTSMEYSGSLPSAPVDQRRHQGLSSYTIMDASNNLDGFDNSRFLELGGTERNPSGGYWLTGGNGTGRPPEFPHVITMMLGTNDVGTPSGVETRLQNIVAKITTLRPNTMLMMARVTPLSGNSSEVSFYNPKVDKVYSTYQALAKNIRLVDLNTTFPTNGLFTDGAHPNDVGFNWMAIQWYEAIIEAFTTTGDQSMGIPPASAVTIVNGATLDLNGNQANVATVNSHGWIHLGEDGQLATTGLHLYATGGIAGTGIVSGPGDQRRHIARKSR